VVPLDDPKARTRPGGIGLTGVPESSLLAMSAPRPGRTVPLLGLGGISTSEDRLARWFRSFTRGHCGEGDPGGGEMTIELTEVECRCASLPMGWARCGQLTTSTWSSGCDVRSVDEARLGFSSRDDFVSWVASFGRANR
jgi:hypothetical protein